MSYILDALKRSETERGGQHSTREALLAGGPPAPAPSRPLWPLLLGLALLANAAVLAGFLLLREPAPSPPSASAPPGGDAPADAAPAAVPEARPPSPPPAEAVAESPEPPPAPAPKPAPVAPAAPEPPAQQAAAPAPPPAAPDPAPAPTATPDAASSPWEGLPYLEELPAEFRASAPEITVDVHVFTDNPEQRFVLVNLRRFREGEQLPGGPRLLHITPDGIALAWQGRRFRIASR